MSGRDRPVPAGQALADHQETILVVEDELLLLMITAMYLRDSGFRVVEASNADEAVRALEADNTIRLVFSDVNMPGRRNGNDLARWLQQQRPAIKIILTSGAGFAAAPCPTGMEGVLRLTKPYALPEIDRLIKHLLERG